MKYLSVVVLVLGLDGLDGAEGGVDEADGAAQQLGCVAEHQPEDNEGGDTCSEQEVVLKVGHETRRHFDDETKPDQKNTAKYFQACYVNTNKTQQRYFFHFNLSFPCYLSFSTHLN